MKITIEDEKSIITSQYIDESLSVSEVIENFLNLCVGFGYSQNSIRKCICELAEEYLDDKPE